MSEGLVIILFVVADIYRSKSPLAFCICIFSKNFFTFIEYQKTSRKDLYFCRLLALILFIKIDEVKICITGVKYAVFWIKNIKRGFNWK